MMDKCNVLITAAGNVFMPGTMACIKKNGERDIRLVGADMSKDETILQICDAAYQVPRGNDPAYIDALLDICRKEQIDCLLPIMSVELNALAMNRDRFTAIGTQVSVSDPIPLAIANHKLKLMEFLQANKMPCADFYSVKSKEDLEEKVYRLGYPEKRVCVKATDGSGSRGFRILDGKSSRYDLFLNEKPSSAMMRLDDLLSVLSEAQVFPELMVMEYLPGTEYSVDLLADHGKVLVGCCRKSLRMENSIMLDAEIVDNPEVLELCRSVTEKLGLDGNIGFDLRENDKGQPVIMECNPRITAGIPYFTMAGVNLPYLCIKKMLGEELPPTELRYGTIVKRRWMEMAT